MTDANEKEGELKSFEILNLIRSGTLSLPEDEKLILTVASKYLDACNITEEDIQWLEQQLEDTESNVTSTNLRNSKYTNAFHLNSDVNKIMGKSEIPGYGKPYELNLYKNGYFFAKRRDTKRPGLLGTLIVILPTEYSGGKLSIEGLDLDEYESKEHSELCKNGGKRIRFIYFDNDLEYSLSEVTNGYRISLVYKIFDNEKSAEVYDPIVELSPMPKEWFDKLLEYAVNFCTGKKNILFGRFKHRGDVSQKLVAALGEKFEVLNVAITIENETDENLKQIKECYYIYVGPGIEWCQSPFIKDYAADTYKVEHVLFPSLCRLEKNKFDCLVNNSKRELNYFIGNLINFDDYFDIE